MRCAREAEQSTWQNTICVTVYCFSSLPSIFFGCSNLSKFLSLPLVKSQNAQLSRRGRLNCSFRRYNQIPQQQPQGQQEKSITVNHCGHIRHHLFALFARARNYSSLEHGRRQQHRRAHLIVSESSCPTNLHESVGNKAPSQVGWSRHGARRGTSETECCRPCSGGATCSWG